MIIKKIIIWAVSIISIFLLIFVFSIKDNNKVTKSGKDLNIFIATDTHYIAESLTDNSDSYKEFATPRDGKQLFYIDEIMDAFSRDIKNANPDILIVSGDLTNNGEKASHLELVSWFKKVENSGTKVYVIPGNHDLLSMWSRGFKDGTPYVAETINHQDFEDIYSEFGYKEAISHDTKTLSYLATPTEDIWLLMIDSNKYLADYGMPSNSGVIEPETLEWIKECSKLAKEKNAQIITVMHHNLMQHSARLSSGNALDNSKEMVNVFKDLGLNITFTGHIHIQDIKADNEEAPIIYDIANSALSVYPQQYGVMKYSPTKGFDYSKARVNVEEWALEQGLKDENLLNFNEYSRNSFASRPYNRAVEELSVIGTYSKDEIEEIANLVADLNLRYFEGTITTIKKELLASSIYKSFINTESEYLYDFVYSMVHNGSLDSSKLKIPRFNPN